jgi:hypothetical protein
MKDSENVTNTSTNHCNLSVMNEAYDPKHKTIMKNIAIGMRNMSRSNAKLAIQ